jgi:hypothetical protein
LRGFQTKTIVTIEILTIFHFLWTPAPRQCITVAVIWPLPKVLRELNSAKRGTPADRPLCPISGLHHCSFGDSSCLLIPIRGRHSLPLWGACLKHLRSIHI